MSNPIPNLIFTIHPLEVERLINRKESHNLHPLFEACILEGYPKLTEYPHPIAVADVWYRIALKMNKGLWTHKLMIFGLLMAKQRKNWRN